MQILQWFTESSWIQTVVLGNKSFIIEGYYNSRDLSWYCNILTSDKLPVIMGKRVIINTDLLLGADTNLKPDGVLFVVSMVDDTDIITRENMGVEVQIVFESNNDLL